MSKEAACRTPDTEYAIPDDATGLTYMGHGIGIDNFKKYLDVDFEDHKINKFEERRRLETLATLMPGLLEYIEGQKLLLTAYRLNDNKRADKGLAIIAKHEQSVTTARAAMEDTTDGN